MPRIRRASTSASSLEEQPPRKAIRRDYSDFAFVTFFALGAQGDSGHKCEFNARGFCTEASRVGGILPHSRQTRCRSGHNMAASLLADLLISTATSQRHWWERLFPACGCPSTVEMSMDKDLCRYRQSNAGCKLLTLSSARQGLPVHGPGHQVCAGAQEEPPGVAAGAADRHGHSVRLRRRRRH